MIEEHWGRRRRSPRRRRREGLIWRRTRRRRRRHVRGNETNRPATFTARPRAVCGGGGADQRTVRSTVRETATAVLGARVCIIVAPVCPVSSTGPCCEIADGDFISRDQARGATERAIPTSFFNSYPRAYTWLPHPDQSKNHTAAFLHFVSRGELFLSFVSSARLPGGSLNNLPHCSVTFQSLDRFASLDSGEFKDSYVPRGWYILVSPADRRYQRHASSRTPLIVEKEKKIERDRPRVWKRKRLLWHERNARAWIRRVTHDDTTTTAGPQHRAALRDRLGILGRITRWNR